VDQLSKKLTTVLVTKIKQELVRCNFPNFCCFRLLSSLQALSQCTPTYLLQHAVYALNGYSVPSAAFSLNDVPIDATMVPSRLTFTCF
jgi:hypothetical protein